jgi:adenylate cyclase
VPSDPRVDRLVGFLLGDARAELTLDAFVGTLVERVRAEGLPIDRCSAGMRTIHPEFYAMRAAWLPETGARMYVVTHVERDDAATPFTRLIGGELSFRARLGDGDTGGYADLVDLRERGFTDWVGNQLRFDGRPVGGLTWATRLPRGFDDAELEVLAAIHAPAAMLLELHMQRVLMGTLLRTYLGADAGERVRQGQIRRGDVKTIRAAIWFSDLRGFTELSARLAPDELIAALNDCFGPMTAAVQAHGGQVLKFIGDGLLAIFPETDSAAPVSRACADALDAALEARSAIDALNRTREVPLRFGLALHVGDAMYGNVGGVERLDFTVIGPAVNRASRIEGQCKPLDRWLLVSDDFAARCGRPLVPLGAQRLKGIDEPVDVFGLPD